MKSAELRDAMVARVKEAAAKWPSFADMPENPKHDIRIKVKADLATAGAGPYISALHSICAVSTPTGRIGNDLVGMADPDAEAAGQGAGGVDLRITTAPADDAD